MASITSTMTRMSVSSPSEDISIHCVGTEGDAGVSCLYDATLVVKV